MTGDFDAFDDLDQLDHHDHHESPAPDSQVDDSADESADTVLAGDPGLAPTTGHPRVDAATAVLDGLDDLPTADHADLFEDVHRRLQGALSDLDGD